MVTRAHEERAHVYRAAAPEPSVVGSQIGRLADRFFKGSIERLATHLVESDLGPEELDRLSAMIEAQRARGKR
jgi:predicted transcriptional regulator